MPYGLLQSLAFILAGDNFAPSQQKFRTSVLLLRYCVAGKPITARKHGIIAPRLCLYLH